MSTSGIKKAVSMRGFNLILAAILFSTQYFLAAVQDASRIKGIVDIQGVRDNVLVGYGLVVGLNTTGDTV